MATTSIPYGEAGKAAFETSDDFTTVELFSGPTPLPVTEEFPVGASTELAAFSVVGLDGGGNLALAKQDTSVQAIGVLCCSVKTGSGETTSAPIFRAGNFNPAALVWDSSYDSEAKKLAAFRGAPTPTNILIRPRL